MISSKAVKPRFIEKTSLPKVGRHIAIIAASLDDLNETGFGTTIKTSKAFNQILEERYAHVTYHKVYDLSSLDYVVHAKPDVVVLFGKYIVDPKFKSKIWFTEYFTAHGLNFKESDRRVSEIGSNKSNSDVASKILTLGRCRAEIGTTL